jgi:virulence-associated protein VagC
VRTADKPTKTRVFRAGNSQAVRIPKALELPEGEVYIEEREGGLFISALRGRWDLFFSEEGADFPFTAKDLRDNRPTREIILEAAQSPVRKKPIKKRKQ